MIILWNSSFYWLRDNQKGTTILFSIESLSDSYICWILVLNDSDFFCIMYVQKALVFIGYKTVDTRSLNRGISKNGTVRTPLALHSPPFLEKFTCQLCLLFSLRNLCYATVLIRWEEGVGERWRRSGPEVRVTLKFFMSRSRVANFHRLILLFVRLLFVGYCGCYSSIVFYIYCIVIHLFYFTGHA